VITHHDPTPMTTDGRRSALVAGVGILLPAVLSGVATFSAAQRLVTEGDASTTPQDILASQGWFRLPIAAPVVPAALHIVVTRALRTFLAPVHHDPATLAAWLRHGLRHRHQSARRSSPRTMPLRLSDDVQPRPETSPGPEAGPELPRHLARQSHPARAAPGPRRIPGIHLRVRSSGPGRARGDRRRRDTSSTASPSCSLRTTRSALPPSPSSAKPCCGRWPRAATSPFRPEPS
jgi:hypothetical protein